MFYEEIKTKQYRSYISIFSLSILYNSKFVLMSTSSGANAVIVTRFTVCQFLQLCHCVLSVSLPHLFFCQYLGKTVLRDCDLSWQIHHNLCYVCYLLNGVFRWLLAKVTYIYCCRNTHSGFVSFLDHTINVKKIAFVNKEHTTDEKMGVSVLLRLFISSNEICNTVTPFSVYMSRTPSSNFPQWAH